MKRAKRRKKTSSFHRFLHIAPLFCVIFGAAVLLSTGPRRTLPAEAPPSAEEGFAESSCDADSSAADRSAQEPPAPAALPEPEPEPPAAEDIARDILSEMTLREKVYQMFIVTQEQLTGVSHVTRSGDTTRNAIQQDPVGGVIYFEPNIQSPEQCRSLIEKIQSYSKLGLFIAVDEEGGRVARLGNNRSMGTTAFPDMAEIGHSGDPDEAYHVGSVIGSDLSDYGFNVDFAPVADVNSNPDNPIIGSRSFSPDPAVAAEMVAQAVLGFHHSGMLCTLKHFPGHGNTTTDSHTGYAEVDKSLDELYDTELIPFQAGIDAGADLVMVGHLSVPQVTGNDTPATLSLVLLNLLREDLGFDGLIVTDSMSMGAIRDRYSSAEAAVKAVSAGVDLILIPADLHSAADGILNAVADGSLTEERIDESVLRILTAKVQHDIIHADSALS